MSKFINWLKKLFGIKAKQAKVEAAEVKAAEIKHEEPKQEQVEVKEEVKVEKAE